ncbi:bifunctional aspartate kinase/homoserine dehydrogenase II [Photobacterium aquimaris]|uniref:Bifunctional aspartokinase/homoserine dehydrogenase n=1 Tax=Photobacterium aquimaris TaxID=512643 RepID=A0A2T3I1Y0_9GAMM|nr:bifunctional aspartate kinase/homoserine dehydrogenase II [Photobacterium aquimaris]OBU16624.1 bifunctional aspartate kinase/homoserine dehydrogenase II [Photobacterium aquimaris]PQJ37541.1 bifunctional aspartate kinase/homoserine dehydrogenase II [Photobacterium aquimaris]PSU11938.1 bifunctional aspartate kinase/homoserine dehydrogenase II [Photobacterium aquimaris]
MIKDLRQLHKFGGSSLADAQCYRRVAEILESYSATNDIVVVSAAGKTTNQLLLWLEQLVTDGRLAHATLLSIRSFQQQLISELLVPDHAQSLLQQLHAELALLAKWGESPLTTEIKNAVLGHGELWSARLLAALLNQHQLAAVAIDSRLFLRADHAVQPAVDKALSQPLLQQLLVQYPQQRLVITGFMAANQHQQTVLLGRNGSDYSATMIGALAAVDRVTIWSDVAGVYSADPRKVANACLLPLLRLDEANELARLAAPVLHSRTLQPVAQSAIDLTLRCSHQPESGSTRVERVLASGRGAKIISSLNDVCLIELGVPQGMVLASVQHDVQQLLDKSQLQPLAQTVDQGKRRIILAYTQEVVNSVLSLLQDSGVAAELRLREGFSMVAAVGAGVLNNPNHCHGFYQQLKGLPVEFMTETESGLSLVAVLRDVDTNALVNAIHQALFQAQKSVAIVLCGKGNIGSHWLSLFSREKAALEQRHGMKFSLIGIVGQQQCWLDGQGIDPQTALDQFPVHAVDYQLPQLLSQLAAVEYDDVVVVDVTASHQLAVLYPQIAATGLHLISANKIAGSATTSEYQAVIDAFAKSSRYWLSNATVGAGLPINHTVRDLRESGDSILAISGVFSGTLSWLFQQFDGSLPFSALLEQAWQQGLTEPDPRHDLDGSDVMRKLVILARESGFEIEPQQVHVESLVPLSLQALSVDDFFEQMAELDLLLAEKLARAVKEDKVLRYVARLNRHGKAYVGLEALPSEHALANLLPCDNIFAIESQWYRENPLVIRGPGAGRDVTAGALISDINRLATML